MEPFKTRHTLPTREPRDQDFAPTASWSALAGRPFRSRSLMTRLTPALHPGHTLPTSHRLELPVNRTSSLVRFLPPTDSPTYRPFTQVMIIKNATRIKNSIKINICSEQPDWEQSLRRRPAEGAERHNQERKVQSQAGGEWSPGGRVSQVRRGQH